MNRDGLSISVTNGKDRFEEEKELFWHFAYTVSEGVKLVSGRPGFWSDLVYDAESPYKIDHPFKCIDTLDWRFCFASGLSPSWRVGQSKTKIEIDALLQRIFRSGHTPTATDVSHEYGVSSFTPFVISDNRRLARKANLEEDPVSRELIVHATDKGEVSTHTRDGRENQKPGGTKSIAVENNDFTPVSLSIDSARQLSLSLPSNDLFGRNTLSRAAQLFLPLFSIGQPSSKASSKAAGP